MAKPRRMPAADDLAFERDARAKYEYVGAEVFAMAGRACATPRLSRTS